MESKKCPKCKSLMTEKTAFGHSMAGLQKWGYKCLNCNYLFNVAVPLTYLTK